MSLWLTSCLTTEGVGGGGVLFCIPVACFPCQYLTTWEYLTGRILGKLLKTGALLWTQLLSTRRVRSPRCSDEKTPPSWVLAPCQPRAPPHPLLPVLT